MHADTHVYKTVPGCEIRADVYRAPVRGPGAHAALIWIQVR